jgi:hypothetical protein
MHAMIISNKGCRKLLNIIGKINGHIDFIIASKNNNLNIYAIKTPIAKQKWNYSHNSDISSNNILNRLLKNIKDENNIPYTYILNIYIFKINNRYIVFLDLIFFILGLISYINKYIFFSIFIFLLINQKISFIISFLLGYLLILILFNYNNNNKLLFKIMKKIKL